MPNLTDLDLEQEKVYLNAPLEGAIIVRGPPGSGKTVMAFHRATALAKKRSKVYILMYNKVLNAYISATAPDAQHELPDGIQVLTQPSWAFKWWKAAYPSKWSKPPLQEGPGSFRPVDWVETGKAILAEESADKLQRLHWGHLVIDEGQDFPPEFYLALNMMRMKWSKNQPGITVFADDNQQLDERHNSTTSDIIDAFGLRSAIDRKYELSRNYRNTKQIHDLAKYYRIHDMEAKDPVRKGELPEVRLLETRDGAIDVIERLCRRMHGKEIGVVVPGNNKLVQYYHKKLGEKLSGSKFRVQGYVGGSKVLSADLLEFDRPNTVTVLNMQSVKGLEFDAVFAVEMQGVAVSEDRLERACKNLFVLCSRARDNLYLCYTMDDGEAVAGGEVPPSLGLLPPEQAGLCKYLPTPSWNQLSGKIKWLKIPRR